MIKRFVLFILFVVSLAVGGVLATPATAQRLLPKQKGLALLAGTNAIDHALFEEGAYTIQWDYSQYFKRFNYYLVGAELNHRLYNYKTFQTPVITALVRAGYMHPLLTDYTKTFLLYFGVAGVGGYQHIQQEGAYKNGATLTARSRFVGGVEPRISTEVFVTNNLVLQMVAKGDFLWGTDLNLFYPSLNVGLKYNF